MYKRICCALLSLCLTLGLMPVGRAAEPTVFQDISPGDWYYDSVSCVYENGLMNGTGEGRFTPGASLTRGMFITILGRMAGTKSAPPSNTAFSDTAANAYYAPYVQWAVQGLPTREQMAVMTARYLAFADRTLPPTANPAPAYTDSDQISPYARDAVELMRTTGLLQGDTEDRFRPQPTAARAAAIFARLKQALDDQTTKAPSTVPTVQQTLFFGSSQQFR